MSDSIDIRKLKRQFQQTNKTESPAKAGSIWDVLNTDIPFGSKLVNDRIKETFYVEMSSLIEAGIDIRTALSLFSDGQKKEKLRSVFKKIQDQIIEGSTFSAAVNTNKNFTAYEVHSLQIGEETGKLLQILKELAIYFNKKIKQRRQIIGAITYPMVVLVVAFSAVSFMVAFVVPMFADTFKRFGNELPTITVAVISFSGFVKKYIGIFLILVFLFICLCIWQRKETWFRRLSSSILLKIPVVKNIIHKVYLARFCNTMSLLIGSKIPMVNSIQLLRQMITFYPIEQSLLSIENNIISGGSLYSSLAEHSIYPVKMVAIVKVAEEVNQLEYFFSRLSNEYSSEVEYQTNMLSKFLEPAIIIVLGLSVGIILIAMYLPMFKLGQTF